jgi:hypothetical protein
MLDVCKWDIIVFFVPIKSGATVVGGAGMLRCLVLLGRWTHGVIMLLGRLTRSLILNVVFRLCLDIVG